MNNKQKNLTDRRTVYCYKQLKNKFVYKFGGELYWQLYDQLDQQLYVQLSRQFNMIIKRQILEEYND